MAVKKAQKLFIYKDQSMNKDLQNLYDWVSRLEVLTANPDGNRVAKFDGEVVKLEIGGNEYIEVARAAGSTIWRGIQLQDVP